MSNLSNIGAPISHGPAAVCKGLTQTMSHTMGLAVPLAERLSCQQYKKPLTRLGGKQVLAPRRVHIERELRQEALCSSSLSVTSSFMWGRKAPVNVRRAERCVWAREGGGGHRRGVFWGGGYFFSYTRNTLLCSKQADPLCGGVWRPFELWTEPAEPEHPNVRIMSVFAYLVVYSIKLVDSTI